MKGVRLLPVSSTSKGRHCDGSFLKSPFKSSPFISSAPAPGEKQ